MRAEHLTLQNVTALPFQGQRGYILVRHRRVLWGVLEGSTRGREAQAQPRVGGYTTLTLSLHATHTLEGSTRGREAQAQPRVGGYTTLTLSLHATHTLGSLQENLARTQRKRVQSAGMRMHAKMAGRGVVARVRVQGEGLMARHVPASHFMWPRTPQPRQRRTW